MGSNPGGDQHLGGFGGIGGGQNGRTDEAWPAKIGTPPVLKFDSKVFETKFAQESKNQYDGGNKGGEAWKVFIRGYLLSKVPMMKYMLKWAEDFGTVVITPMNVMSMSMYLDEDPMIMNHLLWSFLNVNLTDAAREIFCNVPDSEGFEAWRRIHCHIYCRTERRRDELYRQIHDPKSANNAQDVAGMLEEWDTNQRLHRNLGGIDLRFDELKNIVLKIIPKIIRDNLVFKLKEFTK